MGGYLKSRTIMWELLCIGMVDSDDICRMYLDVEKIIFVEEELNGEATPEMRGCYDALGEYMSTFETDYIAPVYIYA